MAQDYTLEHSLAEPFATGDELDEELIPSRLARQGRSGLNIKFLVAGGALIVLIAGLMVYGLMTASSYYLTVDEVQAYYQQAQRGAGALDRRIRVNGEVVDNSERWYPQGPIAEDGKPTGEPTLYFSIHDESGITLPIVFYGSRPDNFQRAASAIIEGRLLSDGSFEADTLLLKCPSRYEEEPEEIFVQSSR